MQSPSSTTSKQSWQTSTWNRAEIAALTEKAVKKYVEWLRSLKTIDLKLIILFGSYADGTFGPPSDVDILIVADKLPEDALDRYVLLTSVPSDHEPLDIEPHTYSPDDFIASANANNQRPTDALIEGQVLYINDEYRRKLISALSDAHGDANLH